MGMKELALPAKALRPRSRCQARARGPGVVFTSLGEGVQPQVVDNEARKFALGLSPVAMARTWL